MCEPNHSIVQFPDTFNDGDSADGLIKGATKRIGDWAKKIWKWFHFSKLGNGHSEAVALSGFQTLYLPRETLYETKWWNRKTILDGYYHGHDWDKRDALECAEEYSKKTSIGNLHLIRQFIEVSMKKSQRAYLYVHRFLEGMLNKGGRDLCHRKLGIDWRSSNVDRLIKIVLGFTRKRNLLVPEWADDDNLWKPNSKIIIA